MPGVSIGIVVKKKSNTRLKRRVSCKKKWLVMLDKKLSKGQIKYDGEDRTEEHWGPNIP